MRPKGVIEGQQVDIPVPPKTDTSDGVTQKGNSCERMEELVQAVRLMCRQIRTWKRLGCDGEGNLSTEDERLKLPRKASNQVQVPVPQTDTGRREENSKARGRTLVKELGKMTP